MRCLCNCQSVEFDTCQPLRLEGAVGQIAIEYQEENSRQAMDMVERLA